MKFVRCGYPEVAAPARLAAWLVAPATVVVAGCGPDTPAPLPPLDPAEVTVRVDLAGLGSDPDGFDVRFDGEPVGRLGVEGTSADSVVVQTAPGFHNVTFGDLAPGCSPVGLVERQLFINEGPNRLDVDIFCRSVDGTVIAYTVRDLEGTGIELQSAEGVRRLRPGGASEWAPSWSPDGARLAMVSDRDGDAEIYLADVEGTEDVRLTFDPAADVDPAWSPDGTRVAFASDRGGAGQDIWLVHVESGELTRLTDAPAPEMHPAWSPDGEWIAFARIEEELEDTGFGVDTVVAGEIYRMRASGGEILAVTDGTRDEAYPTWSPGGDRLFFSLALDPPFGGRVIVSTDLDGEGFLPVTPRNGAMDVDPVVSSDGRYLLYTADRRGRNEVWAVGLDSEGDRRVSAGTGERSDPAWRPDTAGAGPTGLRPELSPTDTPPSRRPGPPG